MEKKDKEFEKTLDTYKNEVKSLKGSFLKIYENKKSSFSW